MSATSTSSGSTVTGTRVRRVARRAVRRTARRPSRSPAATTSRSRCAPPGTGRSCPTRARSCAASARTAPVDGSRTRTASRGTPSRCAGRRSNPAARPTRSSHQRGEDLARLPRGGRLFESLAEPRLRRRRRPHRLPSAGSHPVRPPGRVDRGPLAGPRLVGRGRVARLHPVRGVAVRVRPTGGLHRHGQQCRCILAYPYYLTDEWAYGYRSQRIVDRIEEFGTDIDVDALTAIQRDTRNGNAAFLVPLLLDVHSTRGIGRRRTCSATGTSASPPIQRPRRTSTRYGRTCCPSRSMTSCPRRRAPTAGVYQGSWTGTLD